MNLKCKHFATNWNVIVPLKIKNMFIYRLVFSFSIILFKWGEWWNRTVFSITKLTRLIRSSWFIWKSYGREWAGEAGILSRASFQQKERWREGVIWDGSRSHPPLGRGLVCAKFFQWWVAGLRRLSIVLREARRVRRAFWESPIPHDFQSGPTVFGGPIPCAHNRVNAFYSGGFVCVPGAVEWCL